MNDLPLIPGFTIHDSTKSDHRISQNLKYKNGFPITEFINFKGVGSDKRDYENLDRKYEQFVVDPNLYYGCAKRNQTKPFIPSYVEYDKKVLRFFGYIKGDKDLHEIELHYFLEDNTIYLKKHLSNEFEVGRGKLLRRQRIKKPNSEHLYSWLDLNTCMDFEAFGVTYRLTSCDSFTKGFLKSQGIILNGEEKRPLNMQKLDQGNEENKCYVDKRKRFLDFDKQVLRFFALLEHLKGYESTYSKVLIQYHLSDEKIDVKLTETSPHTPLINKNKIFKNNGYPTNFPSIYLEYNDDKDCDYYQPKDLMIGKEYIFYGKKFFIYDCDNFTRAWYVKNMNVYNMEPIDIDDKIKKPKSRRNVDEEANYLPKRPTCAYKNSDYVNHLRFIAHLDSPFDIDKDRSFILTMNTTNDEITIYEKKWKNSGFNGGLFLRSTKIRKPGPGKNYYGKEDLNVGAKLKIFGREFVLGECGEETRKFLEENLE